MTGFGYPRSLTPRSDEDRLYPMIPQTAPDVQLGVNRHLDRYAELLPRPETTPVDEHGPVASTNKIPV